MVQYISKTALVAEIERRIDEYSSSILKHYDACKEAKAQELGKILTILDTLEVKEVALDKEITNYISGNFFGSGTMGFFSNRTKEEPNDQDIALCAKHFFELGMCASNPIISADRGTAEKIIINLKRVEKDYRIDLTEEIEWLRNKAQKREQNRRKAEKLIQDYTKNFSNDIEQNVDGLSYLAHVPWLTPDQARSAVKIAREEIYEWLQKCLPSYILYCNDSVLKGTTQFIKDLKEAMNYD